MAYDVVKEIRGHLYRYRVESYRDPDSGKVRNRWTYIGRAGDKTAARPKRRTAGAATRETIMNAFLRLVDRKPIGEITVTAIARQADMASATFYRHFHSIDEVLAECTKRAAGELEKRLDELRAIAETASAERKRLRRVAIDLVRKPPATPGLYRAWNALSPEPVREARHAQRIRAFTAYITKLQERGYIPSVDDARRLAIALSMIVMTFTRRSMIEHKLLSEEDYAAVGDVFERIIFLSQ
jgi:AcrR family transcriptional regulator